MKRHLMLLVLVLAATLSSTARAQELTANASHIKSTYPEDYKSGIRQQAVDEWGTDYNMIVFVINQQADALTELINEFKSENTGIAFQAIRDWSIDGFENKNSKLLKNTKTFDLKSLIKLRCDWNMVKFVYDQQVKAKSAF